MSKQVQTPNQDQEAYWDAADHVAAIKHQVDVLFQASRDTASKAGDGDYFNRVVAPHFIQVNLKLTNWCDRLNELGVQFGVSLTTDAEEE